MTEIAEAYFHLDPPDVSESALQRFGQQLSDIAGEAATGIFHPDCIIEVRLKTGTLTAWTLVTVGSLFIGGVLKYKDLKENLLEMVDDAKKFGGWVNKIFIHKNNIPRSKVYRTESRTKTPGKLLRVVNREDRFRLRASQLSAEEREREAEAINRLASEALEDLPPGDRPFVRKMLAARSAQGADKHDTVGAPVARRERTPLDQGLHQRDLFADHPDLLPFSGLQDEEGSVAGDVQGEFYKRFRLRDWQAHHGLSSPSSSTINPLDERPSEEHEQPR